MPPPPIRQSQTTPRVTAVPNFSFVNATTNATDGNNSADFHVRER